MKYHGEMLIILISFATLPPLKTASRGPVANIRKSFSKGYGILECAILLRWELDQKPAISTKITNK